MKFNPLSELTGWLVHTQLDQWRADGVIGPDQEEQLRQRYEKCCGLSVARCGQLALYGLATTAIVLALVLVLYDHWRHIAPLLKVCVALLLMATAHGTGYWYRFQKRNVAKGDLLFIVGTVLFVLGVELVSDAAQVPEFYAWSLFVAAAGTLPLAWVLNSWLLLSLANLLGTAWFVAFILISGDATYTSLFVAQALCLVRWSYVNRSRAVFLMALGSLVLWWCMLAVAEDLGRQGFFWIAALGPLLYLLGQRHDPAHEFASYYRGFGLGLSATSLLFLAMPSVPLDLMTTGGVLGYWLLAIAVVGVGVALVPGARRLQPRQAWRELAALGIVTIVPDTLGIASAELQQVAVGAAIVLAAIYNALGVALGLFLIFYGITKECRGAISLGLIYFTAWAALITYDCLEHPTGSALLLALAGAGILATTRLRFRNKAETHATVSPKNA